MAGSLRGLSAAVASGEKKSERARWTQESQDTYSYKTMKQRAGAVGRAGDERFLADVVFCVSALYWIPDIILLEPE